QYTATGFDPADTLTFRSSLNPDIANWDNNGKFLSSVSVKALYVYSTFGTHSLTIDVSATVSTSAPSGFWDAGPTVLIQTDGPNPGTLELVRSSTTASEWSGGNARGVGEMRLGSEGLTIDPPSGTTVIFNVELDVFGTGSVYYTT